MFEEVPMQRTNVVLDEKLVQEGLKLFKKKPRESSLTLRCERSFFVRKPEVFLRLKGRSNRKAIYRK